MVKIEFEVDDIDGDLDLLEKFLEIIDAEITKISIKIDNSYDPMEEGFYCLGEHIIGYGFISIQRYLTSIHSLTDLKKHKALQFGSKITDDLFLAEVLNAGANYSKHESEWTRIENTAKFARLAGESDAEHERVSNLKHMQINRDGVNFKNSEKITFDIITKITPYAEYTLSNLLAEILNKTDISGDLLFSPLLPLIKMWRSDLDSEISKLRLW